MLMDAECEGVVKSIIPHTSGSALFHTGQLAGAVEEGVAGYTNQGDYFISVKQGWVEARPQQ